MRKLNNFIDKRLHISYVVRVPKGLEDVSKYVELFSALYASGKWTIQELKQLAGLNFLRVWREVEQVCIVIIVIFIIMLLDIFFSYQ